MLAYRMREHGVYFENSGLEWFIFCACTARMHGNRHQSRVWPRMLIVAHVGVGLPDRCKLSVPHAATASVRLL